MSDDSDRREKIRQFPVFIVLARKPGANAFTGLIENSFSMDWSDDRVNMFWSGTAYSILGQHEIDGRENADFNCRKMAQNHPTWELQVYDAHADDCPVTIDWERWIDAMLVGQARKFDSRNAHFVTK